VRLQDLGGRIPQAVKFSKVRCPVPGRFSCQFRPDATL